MHLLKLTHSSKGIIKVFTDLGRFMNFDLGKFMNLGIGGFMDFDLGRFMNLGIGGFMNLRGPAEAGTYIKKTGSTGPFCSSLRPAV